MARYPVDNRIKVAGQIPFGGADPNARFGRHAGDDSANGTGTNVYAPASGTVTGYTSGQYTGKVVEIFDGQYYPHVFHLKDQTVSPGQRVTEGQLIGHSDNTGLSTGPHVHFGVSKVSVPDTKSFSDYIDPMEYIKSGDYIMNDEDAKQLFITTYHTNPKPEQYAGWVGKYTRDQARAERDTEPWAIQNHAITYYDQTKANLDAALAEIERLKKEGADVNDEEIDRVIKETQEAADAAKKLKKG